MQESQNMQIYHILKNKNIKIAKDILHVLLVNTGLYSDIM